MSRQGVISLSGKQVKYLMEKTGAETPEEAMEMFAVAMHAEKVDPEKMPIYIKAMMEKEGKK